MVRGLHWFRSDLRLGDNSALWELPGRAEPWLPVFVLDPRRTSGPRSGESRTRFLLASLAQLREDLARRGLPLRVRRGRPEPVLPRLLHESGAIERFRRARGRALP